MNPLPDIRIRPGNQNGLRPDGDFVLYWMTAFRRLGWNYALQRAASVAIELGKPLVILDALKVDYPFASPRFHHFVLDGMAERALELQGAAAFHYPFVEMAPGEGKGLLSALASQASCVIADDFPSFFSPEMMKGVGKRTPVRLELVDSNGLLPLRATNRVFSAAYHFRRFLQKELPDHIMEPPEADPLALPIPDAGEVVDPTTLQRWSKSSEAWLKNREEWVPTLPLDPSVPRAALQGGSGPARIRLQWFLQEALHMYDEERNHPDLSRTSGLSPYLHFGNISSHEVFHTLAGHEGWTPLRLSGDSTGSRSGWWGMGSGAESFLDQLVTWREVGFNMAWQRDDYTAYASLPEWARKTLENHEMDERPFQYSYEEFRESRTHDKLWNAAQNQLRTEGLIHNYLRMLWGKKILEWSASPEEALDIMLDLNDRYALDGRDPNSYSGIFWCLGRYDRGWPERPIFGKVRSMSSERTMKKVQLKGYLTRHGS